jgi:dolichol-phosphate mannosyltransferase
MNAIVIIPTFNERDNLSGIVQAVLAHEQLRVLVVDDHSPDGTGELADALARTHPGRVDVIHRTGPRGLGRSYVEGMARALTGDAELICQMDADFSHDPKFLPHMMAAAEDYDLVLGSRYVQGLSVVNWPLRRIVLSVAANNYIRAVTGLTVSDCTSGFRCWRRRTLEAVTRRPITSEGYAFQFEMLFETARLGFSIGEVPIVFVERRAGQSKVSGAKLFESLITPWRLLLRSRGKTGRSRAPERPRPGRDPA